jgi:ferredoxin
MPGLNAREVTRNDHAACSGCSLCLLVCPVWRETRNPRLSPEGRAKALQNGATPAELAASALGCTLCAACEPVCPERIDLVGMTIDLRRQLHEEASVRDALGALRARMARAASGVPIDTASGTRATRAGKTGVVLLCGPALRGDAALLGRVQGLIEGVACEDAGTDIALALEAGAAIPAPRLERFLVGLRDVRAIVVEDGFWMRSLRGWLPGMRLASLGEVLSGRAAVRGALRAGDLYVIEPRAYHADYERLVRYYDRLRLERGCAFNLDLQRIAIPATARSLPQRLGFEIDDGAAHARWILKGRNITRIVVESAEDRGAFALADGPPVVHLAELADH